MTTPLLSLKGLAAAYGSAQVLFDISLEVLPGEVVTLMGRNGMGKTTSIKAALGMMPLMAGEVRIDGQSVRGLPSHRIARLGLGLVPEGRRIFPTLSVVENLVATARMGARKAQHGSGGEAWDLEAVFALFPRLRERQHHRGSQLSGGEQQMLAIGRALMTNPRLLILDEATEGLAPLIRAEIWDCLRMLKARGQSILVVDKNVAALTALADRHVILEKGRTVWSGDSAALAADPELAHRYLGA